MRDNRNNRIGHPALGIVLGIVGMLLAFPAGFLLGVVGGAIVGLLGLIALLLGIRARKGGKGIGAIVCGALAIIMAVVFASGGVNMIREMHDKALNSGRAPLLASYAEHPYTGLVGVLLKAAEGAGNNGASLQQLQKEIELLAGGDHDALSQGKQASSETEPAVEAEQAPAETDAAPDAAEPVNRD